MPLASRFFRIRWFALFHWFKLIQIRVLKPGQHLGTNVMKQSNSRRHSDLKDDLKRLRQLAYHRLENSDDLARKFHRFCRSGHTDLNHLQKLYDWLFVPITLWPIDIEGLFRIALGRAAGRRL